MTTRESTISAAEAQSHFDEILRRVENDEAVTIERDGEPRAIIMSVEEYRRRTRDNSERLAAQGTDDKPEWLRMVEETGKLFEEDLKGKKIDWDKIIQDMRDERSEEFLEGLR